MRGIDDVLKQLNAKLLHASLCSLGWKYYGAALLHRTTRAINLTDEGRLPVQGARRLLAEADELEALFRLGVEKISGPIRLSAPIDLGRSYLVPILDAFLAEHPEVTIDPNLTDGYVDLVGQG